MIVDLFLIFLAYSLVGWLMESVYVSILEHRWVNRGFLIGPVCPIYGVGSLLIVLILSPIQSSWLLVILGGALLCSVLEYGTGWLMELAFKNRWWDYSNHRFNLNGRICLSISFAWGLLSLVLVFGLAPAVDWGLAWIPDLVRPWIAGALAILLAVDLGFSIAAVISLNKLLASLGQITGRWLELGGQMASALRVRGSVVLEKGSQAIALGTSALEVRGNEVLGRGVLVLERGNQIRKQLLLRFAILRNQRFLADRSHYSERRLLRAFPKLKSIRHPDALNRLRQNPKLPFHPLRSLKLQGTVLARLHQSNQKKR